jgi:hypothetical protein
VPLPGSRRRPALSGNIASPSVNLPFAVSTVSCDYGDWRGSSGCVRATGAHEAPRGVGRFHEPQNSFTCRASRQGSAGGPGPPCYSRRTPSPAGPAGRGRREGPRLRASRRAPSHAGRAGRGRQEGPGLCASRRAPSHAGPAGRGRQEGPGLCASRRAPSHAGRAGRGRREGPGLCANRRSPSPAGRAGRGPTAFVWAPYQGRGRRAVRQRLCRQLTELTATATAGARGLEVGLAVAPLSQRGPLPKGLDGPARPQAGRQSRPRWCPVLTVAPSVPI